MIDFIREQLATNPIFAGVAGGALVTSVLAMFWGQLRAFPSAVWILLKSQFSVTLTIYGDQPAFHVVNMWLSRHPATKKARRLMAVTDYDGEDQEHRLTLGPGPHLLRQGKRWWIVSREVNMPGGANGQATAPAPVGAGAQRIETLTLTTLGRNPAVFQRFLANVRVESEAEDSVPIFIWRDGWFQPIGRRPRRPIDTVYMNEGAKAELLHDINAFLNGRQWYAERGIPWRRGILLEGPPGTGKTSLIFAIAGELRRPVYLVNPSTINGDAHLQTAMTGAKNGILVLEDIDAAFAARERAIAPDNPSAAFSMRETISLSGLLNAIDGIGAQDGRILFLTSNHPDALDAALLRPGRVDRRQRLDLACADVATQMARAFLPSADVDNFVASLALPMSPAEIQNRLLAHLAGNPVASLHVEIEKRLSA